MIPPRDKLPKSWKELKRYSFDFPFLTPNDPATCPRSMSDILEYLGVEAPGGAESGSSRIIRFDLRFIRTAMVDHSRYWIWGFKDERGSDCYVAVQQTPNGEDILGYDETFGLSPEQWMVMDYYSDEDWENEE